MMRIQTRYAARLFSLVAALLASLVLAAEPEDGKGQFFGGIPTEYPSWFKESFLHLKDDIAEAKTAGKRVMIVFHQNGCPYCNALVERNLSQKNIEDAVRKQFDVVAINMWGDREVTGLDGKHYNEKTFAAANKVQFTPTILFFDEDGQVVLRLNGYLPPARFKTAIDYVGQRHEKTMSFRDYAAAHEPTPAKGEMHKEGFFRPAPFDLSRKANAKGQPIAVFFEQRDCPACDELHGKVLPDKGTRQVIGKFHNVQLDMWSNTLVITPDGKQTTAREWAKALDVKYAPTIVLFDASGKEVIRSEAFFKVFHTQGIFTYVTSGAYKKEPSFQRYLEGKAEAIRQSGKDVDIWRQADEPTGKKH